MTKFKCDPRFVVRKLNYHGIDVHIASKSFLGSLWGHGSLRTASIASEVKFDLRFETSNLIYPGTMCMLLQTVILVASVAVGASDRPRRPHVTSYFNSVTPITYVGYNFLACKCFHELIERRRRRRRRRPKRNHWSVCFTAGYSLDSRVAVAEFMEDALKIIESCEVSVQLF